MHPGCDAPICEPGGVQLADSAGDSQLPPDGLLPLNEVPGVHASVDRAASRLAVDVQPALLNRHEYHTAAADVHPMPSPLGAFYNYDLGAVQSAGPIQLRGLWELGMVRGNWVGPFVVVWRRGRRTGDESASRFQYHRRLSGNAYHPAMGRHLCAARHECRSSQNRRDVLGHRLQRDAHLHHRPPAQHQHCHGDTQQRGSVRERREDSTAGRTQRAVQRLGHTGHDRLRRIDRGHS